MQARDDKLPLHKTLHYRRIREIVNQLCEYENIDVGNFDLFHMRSYRTVGETFNARENVSCSVKSKNGRISSCFVGNNKYDVIEIPHLSNKKNSISGLFLVLAHNTDFDYWIFTIMKHSLNKKESRDCGKLIEEVQIEPYGMYKIFTGSNQTAIISKECDGYECAFSDIRNRFRFFDTLNVRKIAYNVDSVNLLKSLYSIDSVQNKNALIDKSEVKKYHKKKQNYINPNKRNLLGDGKPKRKNFN